jgi:WD40 repeat protein
LEGHVGEIHSCAYKPGSGGSLATGSADGTVRGEGMDLASIQAYGIKLYRVNMCSVHKL